MRHLLTGAGSGIGAAVADRLAARGDELVLVARSATRAEELTQRYAGSQAVVADLSQPEALETALAQHGIPDELDSVLHIAGSVDLAPVSGLDLSSWQEQIAVNLTSAAVLVSAALPAVRRTAGSVVLVNSTAALNAHALWSAYAAAKAGLRAFADALREEEREHGVRVTSVFPGRTATPMQESVHHQEGADYDPHAWIQPATVAVAILAALDLPPDASMPEVTIRPR